MLEGIEVVMMISSLRVEQESYDLLHIRKKARINVSYTISNGLPVF